MIVLSDGQTVEMDDLPAFIREPGNSKIGVVNGTSPASSSASAPASAATAAPQTGAARSGEMAPDGPEFDAMLAKMTLEDLENAAIASALRRFHNNRTRAAMALGISVRTLQRKVGPHARGGDGGDAMTDSHLRTPDDVTNFAPAVHNAVEETAPVEAEATSPLEPAAAST
jgi:DNA-binding NtrC family response regulator